MLRGALLAFIGLVLCRADDLPQACDANPKCSGLGLTGNCCPGDDGKMLDCCDVTLCAVHLGCAKMGLTGQCCPTSDGTRLGCCDDEAGPLVKAIAKVPELPSKLPADCSKNPKCAILHLTGSCCPADDGHSLDCCDTSLCAVNEACAKQGLTGQCCPTSNGTRLGCCDGTAEPEVTAVKTAVFATNGTSFPAECSKNPECAGLHLDGDCCPTATGVQLACCDTTLCAVNEACAKLGLDGHCCPTSTGEHLECCNPVAASVLQI